MAAGTVEALQHAGSVLSGTYSDHSIFRIVNSSQVLTTGSRSDVALNI